MGRSGWYLSLFLMLLFGVGVGLGVGWLASRNQSSSPAAEARIVGLIDIRPDLESQIRPTDVMFIIVTRPGETPPLAVKRVFPVRLPSLYTIGPEDLMIPGRAFQGPVRLFVRIDKDGQAGPPELGDLTGDSGEKPLSIPARDVHILIDTVVK